MKKQSFFLRKMIWWATPEFFPFLLADISDYSTESLHRIQTNDEASMTLRFWDEFSGKMKAMRFDWQTQTMHWSKPIKTLCCKMYKIFVLNIICMTYIINSYCQETRPFILRGEEITSAEITTQSDLNSMLIYGLIK